MKLNKKLLIIFLVFINIFLILLNLSIGEIKADFFEIIKILFSKDNQLLKSTIIDIRLPETLAAALTGSILALSGALIQISMENPLASPYTLGISHGALLGVAFAILFFGLASKWIYFFAFFGAFSTVMILFLLNKIKKLDNLSLVLAGVAISSLYGAINLFLQFLSSDLELSAIIYWTFGDLTKANYFSLKILFICLILGLIYVEKKKYKIFSLELGEEVALSLGVDVNKLKIINLILATFLVSITVSFFGIIGFIGLIVPHLTRLLFGKEISYYFILNILAGSILLILADIFSKTLLAPQILPIGILTSILGAPTFLYLLLRGKKCL